MGAREAGKTFALFQKFMSDVKSGKVPIVAGKDFVTMSPEKFKHFTELEKENENLRTIMKKCLARNNELEKGFQPDIRKLKEGG